MKIDTNNLEFSTYRNCHHKKGGEWWTLFWCDNTLNSLRLIKEKQATNLEKNALKMHLKCWSHGDFSKRLVMTSAIEARKCRLRNMKFQPSSDLQSCVQQLNPWSFVSRCAEMDFGYPLVKGLAPKTIVKTWRIRVRQSFGYQCGSSAKTSEIDRGVRKLIVDW